MTTQDLPPEIDRTERIRNTPADIASMVCPVGGLAISLVTWKASELALMLGHENLGSVLNEATPVPMIAGMLAGAAAVAFDGLRRYTR